MFTIKNAIEDEMLQILNISKSIWEMSVVKERENEHLAEFYLSYPALIKYLFIKLFTSKIPIQKRKRNKSGPAGSNSERLTRVNSIRRRDHPSGPSKFRSRSIFDEMTTLG
jgi:hypothetical protein